MKLITIITTTFTTPTHPLFHPQPSTQETSKLSLLPTHMSICSWFF